MKKVLCVVIALMLLVCTALAETGYDEIDMKDTRETLISRYGEPAYTEEGYADFGGVLCAFYESGRLQAKLMNFDDVVDVAALTEYDFAQAKKLRSGESIENVLVLMGGEGTEIARINLSDEDTSGVQRVLAWKNAKGNAMEMLFELDDGHWVLFAAVEIVRPDAE